MVGVRWFIEVTYTSIPFVRSDRPIPSFSNRRSEGKWFFLLVGWRRQCRHVCPSNAWKARQHWTKRLMSSVCVVTDCGGCSTAGSIVLFAVHWFGRNIASGARRRHVPNAV